MNCIAEKEEKTKLKKLKHFILKVAKTKNHPLKISKNIIKKITTKLINFFESFKNEKIPFLFSYLFFIPRVDCRQVCDKVIKVGNLLLMFYSLE